MRHRRHTRIRSRQAEARRRDGATSAKSLGSERSQGFHPATRCGYTLIEMLVAVALVVLIMSMFAEIFGVASQSISTQRGIAANDQAVRTVTTVIRGDLDKRTFRNAVPFFDGELEGNFPFSFGQRVGFFYISENDPDNPNDDVLHFTVRSTISLRNPDETPFYGSSISLTGDIDGDGDLVDDFVRNPNQPEADDGQVTPDGTSSSPAAEVCYFLRNGILYRRVLLIRNPLPLAGSDEQPTDASNNNFFDPANGLYPSAGVNSGEFWREFDFSAHADNEDFNLDGILDPGEFDRDVDGVPENYGARFHGFESLDNRQPTTAFFPNLRALGQPRSRFGFNHVNGYPLEFIGSTFIGRLTHEETSHAHFNYPQSESRDESAGGSPPPLIGNGNPMSGVGLSVSNGVVTQFAGGPRRGEDILLANVHSFDVEVWDDDLGRFVDIGHETPNGDFTGVIAGGSSPTESQNFNYSYAADPNPPTVATDRHLRFDTWHPYAVPGNDHTPYRAMVYHPPASYSLATPSTILTTHNDSLPIFQDKTGFPAFNVGDRVFAPNDDPSYAFYWQCTVSRSFNPDGTPAGLPGELNSIPPGPLFRQADGGQVTHGQTEYPHLPNDRERDINGDGNFDVALDTDANGDGDVLDVGDTDVDGDGNNDQIMEDLNGNGRRDDVILEARCNWRPLRAIRITIRFLHVPSGQMRQLTLVHSLED